MKFQTFYKEPKQSFMHSNIVAIKTMEWVVSSEDKLLNLC